MSRQDKSNSHGKEKAIQRVGGRPLAEKGRRRHAPRAPQIQVIDLGPAAGGALGYPAPGAAAAKAPGMNILGAVLRRWWLVLLVAVLVGGGGFVLAGRVVSPMYEARALVLYHSVTPTQAKFNVAADPGELVRTFIELLTKPEIALIAARNPELQQALPFLKGVDLENPAVQKEVARQLRGICQAFRVNDTELVEIYTEKSDPFVAAAVVNAFADAFVQHCVTSLQGKDGVQMRKLKEEVATYEAMLNSLIKKRSQIEQENKFLQHNSRLHAAMDEYNKLFAMRNEALIKRLAAQAQVERFAANMNNEKELPARFQLERKRRIEEEKQKDSVLAWALSEVMTAQAALAEQRAMGKKEEHPDVILARERVKRAEESVRQRDAEIAAAIDAKIADEQRLMVAADAQEAQQKLDEIEQQVKGYDDQLAKLDEQAKKLATEQQKLDRINEDIGRVRKQHEQLWSSLVELQRDSAKNGDDSIILVAERADIPTKPTDDKRVKVQAASLVGGLFLGILLALVADRFDRRLKHPKDIEPLLGAPVLGMIPKIQELKKVKGELARNLLAEEFRLIRTQLLFGFPDRSMKTLCVTSPAPGDGKTSLATNLAISLAKAGRRVLLIDADLRKPDLHRIFAVPEAPGFGEMIQGTADSQSAVRRTDIENLDVLPAGLTLGRPAEVLSRPETPQILAMFAELYDHVVFDSAPLLPVSDTHVLLGMVDGVICSFNADVDKEAVAQMEEILRRSHATVIGSVMNQVKFKQTSSYQRGKSAYSSYYTSERRVDEAAAAAAAAATVTAATPKRTSLPGADAGDAMAGA